MPVYRIVKPEKQIQKELVTWIHDKYPDALFTIAPAGVKRGTKLQRIISGREAKEMGYRKGCPDLIFFEGRGGFHGLCVDCGIFYS